MSDTPRVLPDVVTRIDWFVAILLRDDHYLEVEPYIAQLLLNKCQQKYLVFVQMPGDGSVNIFDKPIRHPIVWNIHYYRESTERWLKDRKRAEKERQERFVMEANVARVVQTVMDFTGVDEKFALVAAQKIVKLNQEEKVIKMGGEPFYKTIDELPDK